MSNDWRPDLDVLDHLHMPADVRDRVGKTHVPLPPDHATAKRVIAGVVAFAVFALAAVFAWQAFRPDEHRSIVPGVSSSSGNDGQLSPAERATRAECFTAGWSVS